MVQWYVVNDIERFLRKIVLLTSGCWLWTDKPHKRGYGRFQTRNKSIWAHRWAYEYFIKVPTGDLHHTCLNKLCVNPTHLEEKTHSEHGKIHGPLLKEFCKRGHLLEDAYQTKKGRVCRQCTLARSKQWRDKNPTYMRDYARRKHPL